MAAIADKKSKWDLFVKLPNSDHLRFQFSPNSLAADVNNAILCAVSDALSADASQLYLLISGKYFSSVNAPIHSIGFYNCCTVDVFVRVHGGVFISPGKESGKKRKLGDDGGQARARIDENTYNRKLRERDSVPRHRRPHPNQQWVTNLDPTRVQETWEACIELDIAVDDPYYATSNDDYQKRVVFAERAIAKATKSRENPYSFEKAPFCAAPYSEQLTLDRAIILDAPPIMLALLLITTATEWPNLVAFLLQRDLLALSFRPMNSVELCAFKNFGATIIL